MDPNLAGDSLVQLPRAPDADRGGSKFKALVVYAATPDGQRFELRGLPNDEGRLAKFECQPFEADGFHDASRRAKDAVWGFLSSWSCQLDTPIWIARSLVTELSTGAMQVDWRAPYPATSLRINPAANVSENFRAYAGLYREGISCQSDAYQLLCLYKIAEALWKRRARLAEEAKKAGRPVPSKGEERFPSDSKEFHPWLEAIFPTHSRWDEMALDSFFPVEVRGKRFGWTKEAVEPLRNRIAHALTAGTELPCSDDDALHVQEIQKWLPVLKCVARMMLKNDFPHEFLAS
jgi:hypothetical protein